MKGISGNPVLDAYHRMAISPVQGAATVKAPAPVQNSPSGADNAEVKISAQARELATGASSTHDSAKVADLKSRIAAGDFQVDAARIAERMLDHFEKVGI
jgi:flagellar biosynthesis anti-sigma factor FlgM